MENFQNELEELVDKWLEEGDTPDSMISDLKAEVKRLQDVISEANREAGKSFDENGEDEDA